MTQPCTTLSTVLGYQFRPTPVHYLELTENPYSRAHLNLGGRSHSLYTSVINPAKNGIKLDEETIVF